MDSVKIESEIESEKLAGLSVGEFLERLGSGDPTPGGGAAASLSAAMGAALLMMVANHTIGKTRYAEFEELNIEIRDEAAELRSRFTEGIDRDAEAFLNVSAAFAMPKSPELKAARSAAIGEASIAAAEAPLAVMEDCVQALRLALKQLDHSNPNLKSDIFVAALCLQAGLKSAGYNVDANLPAIERRKPETADRLKKRAAYLRKEADMLTSKIITDTGCPPPLRRRVPFSTISGG